MIADETFQEFFDKVLERHRTKCGVQVFSRDIHDAISDIHYVYSKDGQQSGSTIVPLDYSAAPYRCAYLHKYAALHAALVQHAFREFYLCTKMLKNLIFQKGSVNLCCLGGGPGTDVVGVASVLFSVLRESKRTEFSFTIVDCMYGWKSAFEDVLGVAASGRYGSLGLLQSDRVRCFFITENLLNADPKTRGAVQSADILTMVKFVSAVNPARVPAMLRTVCGWMKPGAVILFIDNACGGFYEKMAEAAATCGLETECEPRRHMKYGNEAFKNLKFGYHSMSSATVAVQMWKKTSSSIFSSVSYRPPIDISPDYFIYSRSHSLIYNQQTGKARPSPQLQYATNRPNFYTAATTRNLDKGRSFGKTNIGQKDKKKEDDRWCIIL